MKKILIKFWNFIKSQFKTFGDIEKDSIEEQTEAPIQDDNKEEISKQNENIMELLLDRIFKGIEYTIGKLYIDGEYFCDTLEDTDRGLKQSMSLTEIANLKVKTETAIPIGTYKVVMNVVSPKYSAEKYKKQYGFCNAKLPRLVNVPGYDGILIHIGNYAKDTDGCILVGYNTVKGAVMQSTDTFTKLYKILETAKDIKITIK